MVTASVTPVSPGAGTPTGTVAVSDGVSGGSTCTIDLSVGDSCALREFSPGTFTPTGTYSGDANFQGSTGDAAAIEVTPDTTTTVLSDNANSPSTGSNFTFRAAVSADGPGAGTPGGFIRWTVTDPNGNSAACADTTLSGGGVALCTVTDAIAGTYRASAEFIDTDGNYQHGSSNGDSVVVSPLASGPAPTSLSLSTNLTTYVTGQAIVVTASVTPVSPGAGTPTGTVAVSDGVSGGSTCTIDLSVGDSCALREFSPGTFTPTGTYSGDANFQGSTATLRPSRSHPTPPRPSSATTRTLRAPGPTSRSGRP